MTQAYKEIRNLIERLEEGQSQQEEEVKKLSEWQASAIRLIQEWIIDAPDTSKECKEAFQPLMSKEMPIAPDTLKELKGNESLELCYIGGNCAYFVKDASKAWGDDWNDIPYEHNAGLPYDYDLVVMFDNRETFIGDEAFPRLPCHGLFNSLYCVEDINRKAVAWLIVEGGECFAGMKLKDFKEMLNTSNRPCWIAS